MTIDDQIKDEKIQYDINREAPKISVLLSGKIGKYEYLTGEEILPSNQKQIIEQAKFIYSPLGKAFEKQTKTIEDQGEKQVKAIKDNKKQLANTNANYINELLLLKEREIFKNIYKKRLDKIEELTKKINYDDLNFIVESSGDETSFTKVEDPMVFLNNIKRGKIKLEERKILQEDFNKLLKNMQKANKIAKQKRTLANVNMLFNG